MVSAGHERFLVALMRYALKAVPGTLFTQLIRAPSSSPVVVAFRTLWASSMICYRSMPVARAVCW
jgi:ABC-type enterobactin transport system permease subunit